MVNTTPSIVYENTYYRVLRCSHADFPNWTVINKEHGTAEAGVDALPTAIELCNQLNASLASFDIKSANVVPFTKH